MERIEASEEKNKSRSHSAERVQQQQERGQSVHERVRQPEYNSKGQIRVCSQSARRSVYDSQAVAAALGRVIFRCVHYQFAVFVLRVQRVCVLCTLLVYCVHWQFTVYCVHSQFAVYCVHCWFTASIVCARLTITVCTNYGALLDIIWRTVCTKDCWACVLIAVCTTNNYYMP